MAPKIVGKFRLALTDKQVIKLPEDCTVIHTGIDGSGEICLWGIGDVSKKEIDVPILIYGTGANLDMDNINQHIGTVIDRDGFVWHIFLAKHA